MAGRVIDALELIKIDQQYRQLRPFLGRGRRMRYRCQEMRAVRQTRQRVRHGQTFQILLAFLAFGNVHHAGHETGFAIDDDRTRRQQRVADRPIAAAQATFEIVDRLPLLQPVEQFIPQGQVDIGLFDIGQRYGAARRIGIQRGAIDTHDAAIVARYQQRERHGHEHMFQRVPAGREGSLGVPCRQSRGPLFPLEPIASCDRDPHAEMKHHHRQDHARHGG